MTGTVVDELLDLPLALIHPGDNDRRHFDDDSLHALSESIAAIGLVTRITVRPTPDGPTPYRIVAGERRWRAHHLAPCVNAGLTTIACTIRHGFTDELESATMLAENTGRVDLGIIEEARGYERQRELGLSIEQIARQSGVAEFRVRWRLDLLTLIPEAQAALASGDLSPQAALELRRLDANRQMIGVKAWLANPTMGANPFRKFVDRLAAAALADDPLGLFGDADPWIEEAKAIKPKTYSIAALRTMIGRLADQLEACGYDGPLLTNARDIS